MSRKRMLAMQQFSSSVGDDSVQFPVDSVEILKKIIFLLGKNIYHLQA
jgi:hypothetical protein